MGLTPAVASLSAFEKLRLISRLFGCEPHPHDVEIDTMFCTKCGLSAEEIVDGRTLFGVPL